MKVFRFVIILALTIVFSSATIVPAIVGQIATEEDIIHLKRALLNGRVKSGETRLKQIQKAYGDAPTINDSEERLVYDYGDIRLNFKKKKYLKRSEYDYRYDPVYTNEIDNLRFDLADQQLVGGFITFSQIRRSYGEPIIAFETQNDGGTSVYHYGEIKLTFENVVILASWRGNVQTEVENDGVLLGSSIMPEENVDGTDDAPVTEEESTGALQGQ